MFVEAHALGQDDAEAIEQSGLGGVGLGDAAQADLAVGCGWQDDVVRLNACEFFEDGARRIAETCALLPHLEALPQHEGEKADQDMRLHAIGALVPDRPHVQLILLDAEGRFGLGELDVGLPELLIAPIADVRAQQISALRERGPVVEQALRADVQTEAGRAAVRLAARCEAGGGALVLLQDAADLPVDLAPDRAAWLSARCARPGARAPPRSAG